MLDEEHELDICQLAQSHGKCADPRGRVDVLYHEYQSELRPHVTAEVLISGRRLAQRSHYLTPHMIRELRRPPLRTGH